MNPRPFTPTKCQKCGYQNGGLFTVCPCCKAEIPHAGDRAVCIASSIVGAIFLSLIVGGIA